MQFRGLASPCLSSSTSNSTSLLQNPKGHQSLYPCDIHMMAMGFLPSCVILCTQIRDQKYSNKGKYVVHKRCIGQPMKSRCVVKPEIVLSLDVSDVTFNGPRVFVLSDLHTDYSENMAWIKSISTLQYKKDVLLVAGDVAETYTNFISTMSILKDRFEHVFYVPGNHDLWCRRKEDEFLDSVVKLDKLLTACRELGVKTSPEIIDGLGIVPLFSWYHESFDNEKDITSIRIPSLEMACKDYHACKWPGQLSSRDLSLALYFDAMNETIDDQIDKSVCRQIISFSHFVPRQELCPEKRMLFYPNLPKIIGSDCLEIRIRSIHGTSGSISACHVFGHTHFCWDAVLDGIRYVQAPLAYPRERKRRMNGGENWLPFCVYANNALTSKREPCFWSDYYSNNARDPENVELAPWVAKFYGR